MGVRFGRSWPNHLGGHDWVSFGLGWWITSLAGRIMWWLLIGWWMWLLAGYAWLCVQVLLGLVSLGIFLCALAERRSGFRPAYKLARLRYGLIMLDVVW